MKKVLIGLVVLVAVVGGGFFYVYSNLDEIVKTAIETTGSETVGSTVQVGSVEIDLLGGSASIYNFSIANPAGYSDQTMMSFSELSISLDLDNIGGDLIGIHSIVARDPYILYETLDDVSNMDTIAANVAGDAPAQETESGEGPELMIASVLIENIQATLESELLTDAMDVSLGDISLQNLSGTPEEIASQIMGPILSQVSANAGQMLLTAIAGMDIEELGEVVVEQLDESLGELEDNAKEALEEVIGEDIREGLGNLFK